MSESLTEQRRVSDEGPLDCKLLSRGKIQDSTPGGAPANYVPAAAVIRRERALSGFIGCKGRVDGIVS